MKKKITNLVQLILLIISFIILNSKNITIKIGGNLLTTSAIDFLYEWSDNFLIPVYVLYLLSAIMCIISIFTKNKYKDGKAHGVIAILLFFYTAMVLYMCNVSYIDQCVSDTNFPIELYLGLLFAVVVVAFAKHSSIIADTKESKAPIVNNIQETTTNADELKKYKELLDSGAITQEEYDAKKKELLGL